jgi:hypothetical protein
VTYNFPRPLKDPNVNKIKIKKPYAIQHPRATKGSLMQSQTMQILAQT